VEVVSAQPAALWETLGVNSKVQLAEIERVFTSATSPSACWRRASRCSIRHASTCAARTCGRDVTIDVGCVFEGRVHLEDGVPSARTASIATRRSAPARVSSRSATSRTPRSGRTDASDRTRAAPGHGTGQDVHIGNFVEIKNSQIADHSKANHLAYVGDATVGQRVNIGAGTITCNYDGVNKHRTVLEDDVFIGSDTQLVAPVTVRRGATIGAGTTLTKEAPADKLTLSRAKQMTLDAWQRPVKQPKK
jgi:bifunctional UDP-N-acetylglucosamine pyrophosphorylase/glucosamine-1-phosphate N-acetyltransferase